MRYSAFRHVGSILSKHAPIHLTFFVTRRCNAHCPFCFYLKSDDALQEREELSLEEIQRISGSMGKLLWLAFSGGEIFLRKDLPQISMAFYRNNKPAIMLFPTNGMLPEVIRSGIETILAECRKSVIVVKLSIDGLHKSHDDIRNTPGSFERTMNTYRLLQGLLDRHPNFELGVNTVFSSVNQHEMDGIIDFVAGLEGIKTHTISLARGNLRERQYCDVDLGLYEKAIRRLEKELKTRKAPVYRFAGARIKAAQDILQRDLIHRTLAEQKQLIPCFAGRLNLVLTESGEVYPCEILTSSFGNVRDFDYDLERLRRSGPANRVVRSIMSGRCFCTHECYFMTNILFNPRLYPALAREYLGIRQRRGPV